MNFNDINDINDLQQMLPTDPQDAEGKMRIIQELVPGKHNIVKFCYYLFYELWLYCFFCFKFF